MKCVLLVSDLVKFTPQQNATYSPVQLIYVFFFFMMHFLTDAAYTPERLIVRNWKRRFLRWTTCDSLKLHTKKINIFILMIKHVDLQSVSFYLLCSTCFSLTSTHPMLFYSFSVRSQSLNQLFHTVHSNHIWSFNGVEWIIFSPHVFLPVIFQNCHFSLSAHRNIRTNSSC